VAAESQDDEGGWKWMTAESGGESILHPMVKPALSLRQAEPLVSELERADAHGDTAAVIGRLVQGTHTHGRYGFRPPGPTVLLRRLQSIRPPSTPARTRKKADGIFGKGQVTAVTTKMH
jgi:hypothetical protein